MNVVGFGSTTENRSVLQNQPVFKQQSKNQKGTKRIREKNEHFNGFYYLSMKPKILVPRVREPLNCGT